MLETSVDRRNEEIVAAEISQRWNWFVKDMGPYHPYDLECFEDNYLCAIAEVKTFHSKRFSEESHLPVNWNKYTTLISVGFNSGINGYFVVKLLDGIFWASLSQLPVHKFRKVRCGRKDRGCVNDVCGAIWVPADRFHSINEVP